jgi:hypothetical protein
MSESASESQKRFSSSRSSTGSLAMPPSGSVMNAYFAWRTAHLVSARGHHVGEGKRVRAGDLDLTLDAHVPHRHAIQKRPVLPDRVAVVTRVVGVVVDAVAAHPVLA